MGSDRQEFKDKIYLDMAKSASMLSKDKNTKVGCIIMSSETTPVSHGYNGTVSGFDDNVIPHSRDKEYLSYYKDDKLIKFTDDKYNYMIHAERNAMHFADKNKLIGSTMYVTGLPCKACSLEIAKNKIARVVVSVIETDENSTIGKDSEITEFIFSQAGIKLIVNGKEIFLKKNQ